MEKHIKYEDQSNDRDYFTMVPNYILNHSTAITQALYLQIKRRAGEKGTYWESQRSICKKLGIGKVAYKKSIDYMLAHGWIADKGFMQAKTKGGVQAVKVYSVNDIWKINADFFAQGGAVTTPLAQGEAETDGGGEAETAPNKNPVKEEPKVVTNVTTGLTSRKEKKDRRNPAIDQLEVYGNTLGFPRGIKYRYAIFRLLRGGKTVEQLMEAAKLSQEIRREAYAPQINSWQDLEYKFLKLRDFFVRQQNSPKKGKIYE